MKHRSEQNFMSNIQSAKLGRASDHGPEDEPELESVIVPATVQFYRQGGKVHVSDVIVHLRGKHNDKEVVFVEIPTDAEHTLAEEISEGTIHIELV